MRDFDYEVMQRKNLARQAAHRKRGSKSKKCTLPSDGMTHKQWKERNGEIVSYNLKKPMGWEQFKSLPRDVQQLYICTLQEQYDASVKAIAGMFGIGQQTLHNYIKKHSITAVTEKRKRSGEQMRLWLAFCKGEQDVFGQQLSEPESAEEPAEAVEEEVDAYISPEPAETKKAAFTLDNFTLEFSGEFDPDAIRNSLAMILKKGQRVRLQIRCEAEGG